MKPLNPTSIPTVPVYFEITVPLTAVTIWIIVAFQSEYMFKQASLWKRIAWPYYLVLYLFKRTEENTGRANVPLYARSTPYYKVLW